MRRSRALALVVFFVAGVAAAQPGRRPTPAPAPAPTPPASTPGNVRAHVGPEYAARLLRSAVPEERLRGIQRLSSIGTPEAVALLVSTAEVNQTVRSDSRGLVELARALARFTDQDRARAALLAIVNVGNPGIAGRLPQAGRTTDALSLEDGDPVARTELAREIAAIALARSGVDRALEQLYGVARGGGSGKDAALLALALFPPRDPGFFGTASASLPANVVRMLGRLGDLRAIEIVASAAKSTDVTVRSAALVALADLGDERAVGLARTAIIEPDARLRAAAGEAFVVLVAPERFKAVAALMSDEATSAIAVRLAERVSSPEITKLLAARAFEHPDRELRAAAIRALGRAADPAAAQALVSPKVLADPVLQYHAMLALARSPAPNATDLVAAVAAGNLKTLGVRAYVVRALLRGERSDRAEQAVDALLASRDPTARAVGVYARVALANGELDRWLDDKEPRVRRAAAMASLARRSPDTDRALLARLRREQDDTTRQVLSIGLLSGDPDGALTTTSLVDRAEAGGADAPLAAFSLARRADDAVAGKVERLLASRDAVLRAHTARGLAFAPLADASGRLADLYAYETDVDVRRAVVWALAARTKDASAPARKTTLETAAGLDPDGPTRLAARRGAAGAATPFAAPITRDVAWLRVTLETGASPGEPYVGALVDDGVAIPMAFDDEGYAIVAGLTPGEARLVLAPRLPSYKSSGP
jgi:HEAT repeat protein